MFGDNFSVPLIPILSVRNMCQRFVCSQKKEVQLDPTKH